MTYITEGKDLLTRKSKYSINVLYVSAITSQYQSSSPATTIYNT